MQRRNARISLKGEAQRGGAEALECCSDCAHADGTVRHDKGPGKAIAVSHDGRVSHADVAEGSTRCERDVLGLGMETQESAFWQHDYPAMLERARDERKFVFLDIFNPH